LLGPRWSIPKLQSHQLRPSIDEWIVGTHWPNLDVYILTCYSNNINTTALPIKSDVEGLELSLSLGFRPELLFNLELEPDLASLSAGVYVNLPKLESKFSQRTDVDQKCAPIGSIPDPDRQILKGLGNMTYIQTNLTVDAGVTYQLVSTIGNNILSGEASLVNVTMPPGPTACMVFDRNASQLLPAEAQFSKAYADMMANRNNSSSTATATATVADPGTTTTGSPPPAVTTDKRGGAAGNYGGLNRVVYTGLALTAVAIFMSIS